MKTEKIYTQHEENKEWMNKVSFYKDEIRIMKGRLEEIVTKNTSGEVTAQVEHFQNQLIIQNGHLDTIMHGINISKDHIAQEILKNEVAVDHRSISDHTDLREKMESFETIFTDLKKALNAFLSKWM